MLTSAQCLARAELEIAEADHDELKRSHLIAAAEAWIILASQLRKLEIIQHTARAKSRQLIAAD